MSRILLLNGSPHKNGCIATAFAEMLPIFAEEGIYAEVVAPQGFIIVNGRSARLHLRHV